MLFEMVLMLCTKGEHVSVRNSLPPFCESYFQPWKKSPESRNKPLMNFCKVPLLISREGTLDSSQAMTKLSSLAWLRASCNSESPREEGNETREWKKDAEEERERKERVKRKWETERDLLTDISRRIILSENGTWNCHRSETVEPPIHSDSIYFLSEQ